MLHTHTVIRLGDVDSKSQHCEDSDRKKPGTANIKRILGLHREHNLVIGSYSQEQILSQKKDGYPPEVGLCPSLRVQT